MLLQKEFEGLLGYSISSEHFTQLETIYTYYPLLSLKKSKEQVINLYKEFGIGIIQDMMPRASIARNACKRV